MHSNNAHPIREDEKKKNLKNQSTKEGQKEMGNSERTFRATLKNRAINSRKTASPNSQPLVGARSFRSSSPKEPFTLFHLPFSSKRTGNWASARYSNDDFPSRKKRNGNLRARIKKFEKRKEKKWKKGY